MTNNFNKEPKIRFIDWNGKAFPNWEEKSFNELSKFTRGPFGGALKKEIFVNSGYAVYEQSHAIHRDFNSFRYYITKEKFDELKRFSVLPNDIIMSCSGTMGKFAIVPAGTKPGIINQALLKLTINVGNNIFFIKNTLELSKNQDKLLSKSAGGAIKNVVEVAQIKEIKLSIPSLPEQQKIATFLSAVDEKIQLLTRKKELLTQYKKGVMQQLFSGELRFKDEQGKDFPEWEETAFCDIADKKIKWSITGGPFGSNLKAEDYTENGIRIIQLQNIGDGEFLDDYKIYTSIEKADELISCNIYGGDIILSKMGDPVARACIIPSSNERWLMSSDGIRLVIDNSKFDKWYIYEYINSPIFRKKALTVSTGTTRKRIGLSELKQIPIFHPCLEEQIKIGSLFNKTNSKLSCIELQITQTQTFKKGLLQQMFV